MNSYIFEFMKRQDENIKCEALSRILLLIGKEFNKWCNTGDEIHVVYFIDLMRPKVHVLWNLFLVWKRQYFAMHMQLTATYLVIRIKFSMLPNMLSIIWITTIE